MDLEAVRAALAQAGRGSLVGLAPIRAHWGAQRWQLELEDGQAATLSAPPTLPGRGVEQSLAIGRWAEGASVDWVPRSEGVVVAGRPMVLLWGLQAATEAPGPADLVRLGEQAAAVCTSLAAIPVPRHGLYSGGFELWPQRASWGAEIAAHAQALHGVARSAGTDLGPWSDALVARVQAARPALDRVSRFTLAHRDLGPETLHGERVSGWDRGCFGDPLLSWVSCLLGPLPALGAFLEALGPEAESVLTDPDALARVDAYVALYALDLLAHPSPVGPDGAVAGAASRQRALVTAVHWPGLTSRAASVGSGEDALSLSLGAHIAPRMLLDRLAGLPDLGPEPVEWWLAALGAVGLAHDLQDPRLLRYAVDHARLLPAPHSPRPAVDPEAARAAIVAAAVSALSREGAVFHRAAAIAWLGLDAIDRLDGGVSGATWSGLWGLVVTAAAMDEALDATLAPRSAGERAAQGLCHGLLGLAAARSGLLGELEAAVLERLIGGLQQAAAVLHTPQQVLLGAREPVSVTVERLVQRGRLAPRQAIVAAALLATARTEPWTRELLSPDALLMLYGLEGPGAQGG